jgi:ABC-type sugar transport system permease subunit
MKTRTQEAAWGYILAFPAIAGAILFLVYPIAKGLWLGFTDYNPLRSTSFTVSLDIGEELELQYGIVVGSGDLAMAKELFDVMEFVEYGLAIDLSDAQRAALERFDETAMLADLHKGKLSGKISLGQLLSRYLPQDQMLFRYKAAMVGLDNFRKMLGDQYFWITLGNSFMFAIVVVTLQTFLSVLLALAANGKNRSAHFFKVVFFIPSVTSSAAISMIFWMLYSKPGIINRLFGLFGFQAVDWLNNTATALPSVMVLNIWTTAGFFMIAFLAGLQNIPEELYECAAIEGAPPATVFFRITLPMLRPQILYVVIMGTIGCLQVFDQVYFLIPNMRNATYAFYIYKNAFQYGNMGYASALAAVFMLVILAITAIQRKVIRESAY